MIQRKQILLLLASLVLLIVQLLLPICTISYNADIDGTIKTEVMKLMPFCITSAFLGKAFSAASVIYGFFLLFAALFSGVAVFLYKHRPLQMRFTMFALLAAIVSFIAGIAYLFTTLNPIFDGNIVGENIFLSWGVFAIPIVVVILLALAHRMILKDEVLIQANDRFR